MGTAILCQWNHVLLISLLVLYCQLPALPADTPLQWWPVVPTCLLGHPWASAHHLSGFLITVLQTDLSSSSPVTPACHYFCPLVILPIFTGIFFLLAPHYFVEMMYFLSSPLLFEVYIVVSQISYPTFRILWIFCSQFFWLSSTHYFTFPSILSIHTWQPSPVCCSWFHCLL